MMNSFFGDLSAVQSGEFKLGDEPVPKGRYVATCEEAKLDSWQGVSHISLKWRINRPEAHSNRVVYQKIKVFDADASKAANARNMLAAIAFNAGGKLFEAMKQAGEQSPSDASLQHVINVPMVLEVEVWEMDGKTGNWVSAVSKYAAGQQQAPQQQMQQPAQQQTQQIGDDIPF